MATSVGSFPRPTWLAHTQRNQLTYRLEGDALKEAMDDATALVMREQEDLGLDILTDGEMRRTTSSFTSPGHGTASTPRTSSPRRSTAIATPIAWCRASPARSCGARRPPVDDLRAAKAHTSRPLKMAVPGPMTVIDSASNEFYEDEDELAFDVAAAINGELRDLQAAGCAVLQIDEPAMTRYHDKVARLWRQGARPLPRRHHGADHRASVLRLSGRRRAAAPVRNTKTCCRMLMQTRIGGFTVEFGRSSFDPQVLKICGDRIVMFGCVDPGDSPAPTVDAGRAPRRRRRSIISTPSRCWLAPDCGLMTISRALAHEKLRVMVEAG